MNSRTRIFAAIAVAVALPLAYAQLKPAQPTPEVIAPPEKSAPGKAGDVITPPQTLPAAGAPDCDKAANKTLPACVQDKGLARPAPAAEDPGIKRTPPPTGDAIANPRPSGLPDQKKAPR